MKSAAAVLISVLSLVACGGSSGPTGASDAGNNGDAGNSNDAGNSDAGSSDAGADGGTDGGPLGDLHVTWTIDGVDTDHPGHCSAQSVDWFAARISPAAPDGGSSMAAPCSTAPWSSGNAFLQLTPGSYQVTFESHSGACCTGVATASTSQTAVVTAGHSTSVTFDYRAPGY